MSRYAEKKCRSTRKKFHKQNLTRIYPSCSHHYIPLVISYVDIMSYSNINIANPTNVFTSSYTCSSPSSSSPNPSFKLYRSCHLLDPRKKIMTTKEVEGQYEDDRLFSKFESSFPDEAFDRRLAVAQSRMEMKQLQLNGRKGEGLGAWLINEDNIGES